MDFKLKTVTVAENGTYSGEFTLESYSIFIGALFPAMDNGDIGLALSVDDGDNYNPILDPSDGNDAVLCGSGDDPGWVDFSDWIRFVPQNAHYKLRFTCASQTSGAVDMLVLMRG